MPKATLAEHGTVFDCGPVMSNAKLSTMPGQYYFGGTAPEEHCSKHCSDCVFYRVKPPAGGKPKDEGNALKKGPRPKVKGVCRLNREAMKKETPFEGQKALACKYFEALGGGV